MKKNYFISAILVLFLTLCSFSFSSFAQDECTIGASLPLPYTNDFESNSGDYYACWSRLSTLPNLQPYQNPSHRHSGTKSIDFNYTQKEGDYSIAIMPKVADDINVKDLKLNFWLENTGEVAVFEIGVMTDNTDMDSFESLDVIQTILDGKLVNNKWVNIDYLFNKYEGEGKYIAFRVSNAIGTTCRIDDITLDKAPACVAPTDITISNIKVDAADISWKELGSATAWTIEYGEPGFGYGTGTSIKNLTSTSYTLTGLERGKAYDVYVYSLCNNGADVSEPSLVKSFTCDMCEPEEKCTYYFDMSTTSNNGWQGNRIKVFINGELQQEVTISQAGVKKASYDISICNDVEIVFAYGQGTTFRDCSFDITDPDGQVIVSCVNGKMLKPVTGESRNFTTYEKPMYKGKTNCSPVSCVRPQAVTSTNIEPRTATVTWKAGSTETAWNVKYCKKGSTDIIKSDYVEDNPIYYLEDLTPEESYDFYVQAICSKEENSLWALFNFTTPASCRMPDGLHPDDEHVTAHQIPIMWEPGDAGKWWVGMYTPETFGEQKTIFDTVVTEPHFTASNLESASVYMFEVKTLCDNGDTSQAAMFEFMTIESCMMPQSFNVQDIEANSALCTWIPRGEETQWEFQYKKNVETDYISIIVESPEYKLTDLEENTAYTARVRAICEDDDYSQWSSKSFTTERTPCAEPTNLTFSNITTNGAVANWNAEGTAKEWNVQYKAHAAETWSSLLLNLSTSYTFSNLLPDTKYDVRVQSVCGIDYTSEWIYGDFTTEKGEVDDNCTKPTNVQATNITKNSATITWEQAEGTATSWTVHQRVKGSTEWNTSNASTKQAEFTDLTPETTYEVEIIANCDNNLSSDPSDIVTFTTKPDAISDYILNNNINLYPNPTTGIINCNISGELIVNNIEVYDIYGKLLMTRSANDTNFSIDVTSLADGMYFIRICTDKGNAQKAFIKK